MGLVKLHRVSSLLFTNLDGIFSTLTKRTIHLGIGFLINSRPRFQRLMCHQALTNLRTKQLKLSSSLHLRKYWRNTSFLAKKRNSWQ